MSKTLRGPKKVSLYVIAAVLALQFCSALQPSITHALPITERSLTLSDVNPGAIAAHTFKFTFASSASIGSVKFEYCTSPLPDIACDAPAGLDAASAVLTQQTGENDFVVMSTQANGFILTRPVATAPVSPASTYTFSPVTNPTGAPGTFYVRISTHQSLDASDAPVDFGAVVNSTTQAITLSTEVPPILKFCVGLVLATDCTTADENLIDLGDLSPTRAGRGSSQMIGATNAQFGLAIAAYGTTMTSGINFISALTSPTVSAPGNAQFGLNLRNNSDPDIGEEPSGSGIANPTTPYNIPNRYTFNSGDVVATSPDATDVRKFTVSYIVNVPPSQAPGVYTATLTYVCTATF